MSHGCASTFPRAPVKKLSTHSTSQPRLVDEVIASDAARNLKGAAWLFGDHIPLQQLAGIALIIGEIAMVARS